MKENFAQDDVKAVVAKLREQAIEDVKSEVEGAVAIAEDVCISYFYFIFYEFRNLIKFLLYYRLLMKPNKLLQL